MVRRGGEETPPKAKRGAQVGVTRPRDGGADGNAAGKPGGARVACSHRRRGIVARGRSRGRGGVQVAEREGEKGKETAVGSGDGVAAGSIARAGEEQQRRQR